MKCRSCGARLTFDEKEMGLCSPCEARPERAFNDDMIRRRLPADVMALIHDLAYYHPRCKWPIEGYVLRAQEILKRKKSPVVKGYSRESAT